MIRTIATAIALTLAGSAQAQTTPTGATPGFFTVSGAGGYDDQTRNFWSGVEVALRPNNTAGFGIIANATPAFGFSEGRSMGFAELGIVRFVRAERAIVRVGLVARTSIVSVPYRVAIEVARKDDNRVGLVPSGLIHIEFQYGTEQPFIFGIRAGMGTALSNFRCVDPDDLSDCAVWTETATAAAFGSFQLRNGLFSELMIGHTTKLAIGYTF